MSIAVAPLKIKGSIRQGAIKYVQTQIQSAVLSVVGQLIMACLEAEVEAVLGRPKYAVRTVTSTPRLSQWQCRGYGNNDANNFTPDGHYKRTLETQHGHLG